MMRSVEYSVVMVLEDESEFSEYLFELHQHLSRSSSSYELIVLLNGPNIKARERLAAEWPSDGPQIMLVELSRKVYSGTCLQALLEDCRGEKLIICGPYRQVAGEGLSQMMNAVSNGEADMALPWRQKRVDPAINQLQSRLFNTLVRMMTGVALHDLNCTLRVIRREVLEETIFHGDLYRFLPLMAQKRGFRVVEIPTPHVQERGKVGYFGLRVYINRLIDLLTIHFNLHFARKPLRYFGLRGGIIFFVGLLLLLFAFVSRLAGTDALGDSPMLMVGLILILTGSGLWGVGLLGEIFAFTLGRKRKEYIVDVTLE